MNNILIHDALVTVFLIGTIRLGKNYPRREGHGVSGFWLLVSRVSGNKDQIISAISAISGIPLISLNEWMSGLVNDLSYQLPSLTNYIPGRARTKEEWAWVMLG